MRSFFCASSPSSSSTTRRWWRKASSSFFIFMKNGSSFLSLSLFSLFSLKWWRRRAEKFSLLFSLFLFSTQQARARKETRSLWDEALERRSASGLSLQKEQIRTGGGSFSLAFALSSVFLFLSGKEKKNCVKDMRVHVTSSFLFCLGF